MDFQIRAASAEDIKSIVYLWKELSVLHAQLDESFELSSDADSHYSSFLPTILESQKKNEAFLFVAEVKDTKKIVGYILGVISKTPPVFKTKEFGSIYDICVSEEFREQNIGRQLVSKVKKWCKNQEIKRLEMSAASTNPTAIAFWETMGFTTYMEKMYHRL